jgi:hypothetical protein
MAVVKLDPVTYPKYWKIVPDNASPNVFFLLKKPLAFFKQASTTSLLIYDQSGIATTIATTGADAVNSAGTTLATAILQIGYIITNND